MANTEHLQILKRGAEVWNEWRNKHVDVRPDLRDAQLREEDLSGANLSESNLRRADLSRVDFRGAVLRKSDLSGANLSESLFGDTDLSGAQIFHTNLNRAYLSNAIFSDVKLAFSSFGGNDLSQVIGLETVNHRDHSHVGIDTIYNSGGNIPEAFLRDSGVPDDFIVYMQSWGAPPYHSCFISYSSKEDEFAGQLYKGLKAKGIRVWCAAHDMKIGARIRLTLDELIRDYDKMLLILSENSVSSQWVEQEVETALAREREPEGKTVIFPIRVDNAIMKIKTGWPALLKNTRNVGDFTRWKDHDFYKNAFDRLLRDLRAEEKTA